MGQISHYSSLRSTFKDAVRRHNLRDQGFIIIYTYIQLTKKKVNWDYFGNFSSPSTGLDF